jgi:hypothetical protein
MIRKSYIRAAAAGGLTATVALLSGLAVARADELSDLKSNQQLLMRRIEQLEAAQRSAPGGAGAAVTPSAERYQSLPGGAQVQSGAPQEWTPAGPGGGSFPRSFLIPGTDTSIRIGGFARGNAVYYMSGSPGTNGSNAGGGVGSTTVAATGVLPGAITDNHNKVVNGVVQTTAAQHSRGHSFNMTAKESRVGFETRTPTAWGEAKTFIEFDFSTINGNITTNNLNQVSSSWAPRLRHAYGTLGGFLVGQTNSNFRDLDSDSETLDFGGFEGDTGVTRLMQARYTYAGPYGTNFSVSIEDPETDAVGPFGFFATDTNSQVTSACGTQGLFANAGVVTTQSLACVNLNQINNPTYSPLPDFTAAANWYQPWGHINARMVLRDLGINDGKFISKQYLGYGGAISGDVKGFYGRDNITWGFAAGDGIGRYISDGAGGLATNFTTTPGSAAIANANITKTITEFGGHIGYQHFWTDQLRSSATFGMTHSDVPTLLIGPQTAPAGLAIGANPVAPGSQANKELDSVHVNLIWSPVAFVDIGLEYIWGHRVTTGNLKGDLNAVEGQMTVKF